MPMTRQGLASREENRVWDSDARAEARAHNRLASRKRGDYLFRGIDDSRWHQRRDELSEYIPNLAGVDLRDHETRVSVFGQLHTPNPAQV